MKKSTIYLFLTLIILFLLEIVFGVGMFVVEKANDQLIMVILFVFTAGACLTCGIFIIQDYKYDKKRTATLYLCPNAKHNPYCMSCEHGKPHFHTDDCNEIGCKPGKMIIIKTPEYKPIINH